MDNNSFYVGYDPDKDLYITQRGTTTSDVNMDIVFLNKSTLQYYVDFQNNFRDGHFKARPAQMVCNIKFLDET